MRELNEGIIVKKVRLQQGITLMELSDKSGKPPSYYNAIESCKRPTSYKELKAIFQLLVVPISDYISLH